MPTMKWTWTLIFAAAWASAACDVRHAAADDGNGKKQIVFIAGGRSHGFGAHDHRAGSMLLAKAINDNVPQATAKVIADGWPKDAKLLDDAACIVMYGDGGGGHMVNARLEQMNKLAKRGVGIVCIHYAVEVPKGQSGDYFVDWIGGYFETFWSVNPHWTASFKEFPKHPISRGVRPFAINDEWYYHMRFRKDMQGVTPVLTAVPPDSTRKGGDGPHSGNPTVRSRLGLPEHVAWATERPDGGRGFGFTGGHVHWNWGHDDFRKLMLNAIVWCAKLDVPEGGVPSTPVTLDDLLTNHDEPMPQNFDRTRHQRMLDEWRKQREATATSTTSSAAAAPTADESGFQPLFDGKTLDGWDGNPKFWSVKDGAIVGHTTKENPTDGNTFLVWRKGDVDNFELRLTYRIKGGNSGVQYRSKEMRKWRVGGYQGDFEAGKTFSGILYDEGGVAGGRGIMAQRGEKVAYDESGKKSVVGSLGNSAEIQAVIKPEDWNDYTIIAHGPHLRHFINGRQTVDVVDHDAKKRLKSGILALQLHAGDPMTVEFKNIRIKMLKD